MSKHFIVFSQEELDKIKNGGIVIIDDLPWLKEGPFNIYCVSEEWMQEFDSNENLP
jgi:hypothetical protein|nr:MAG TPA: hypothetical protein [Caudoviricetes sp.]